MEATPGTTKGHQESHRATTIIMNRLLIQINKSQPHLLPQCYATTQSCLKAAASYAATSHIE
ncbi:hypothetical protein GBAR_LOCUS13171 [Geodia barretti]|uniref:Uncharacterized protein n=1 Tax=Geodia barretti TaxID=519541 RepID=A0AA35S588_GEOBA|nr:hypothetical protein GBAR_LOCUS13171 [Geodia barretti]